VLEPFEQRRLLSRTGFDFDYRQFFAILKKDIYFIGVWEVCFETAGDDIAESVT
jgi:hypothetical protein